MSPVVKYAPGGVRRIVPIIDSSPAPAPQPDPKPCRACVEQPHVAASFLASIIYASRDEGELVAKSVRSAVAAATGPLEIIVVDDASRDGSCDNLQNLVPLGTRYQLIRTDSPVGAGAARNLGLAVARGRVAWVCDSHIEVAKGLWHDLGRLAVERRAIVCGHTYSMELRVGQGCGAWLRYDLDGRMGIRYEHPGNPVARVEAPVGGCYGVPRELLSVLPSWPSTLNVYGQEEEALGLWAWLHDVPVLSHSGYPVYHLFRSEASATKRPVPWGGPKGDDKLLGAAVAYCTNFEPETWQAVWRPKLVGRLSPQGLALLEALEDGELCDVGQWRAGKVRTDYEFMAQVLRLPCVEGPRGTVTQIHPLTAPKTTVPALPRNAKPLISIILPTYQRDNLLRWGLRSIRAQKRDDVEIIVVNDGPQGETQAIASEFGARYLHTGRREGGWRCPSWSINIGVRASTGPILILSNPEIWHFPGCIEELLQPLMSGSQMQCCIPRRKMGAYVDDGTYLRRLEAGEAEDATWLQGLNGLQTQVPFIMALRRELFIAVGGYDEDFTGHSQEDCDFMGRVVGVGGKYAETEAHAVHLWHGDQHPNQRDRYLHNIRLYDKRYGQTLRNQGREWGVVETGNEVTA